MKIIFLLITFFCFHLSVLGQSDAGKQLFELIKVQRDADYASLNLLIHPKAKYLLDGKEANSTALIVLNSNFRFLNSVYQAPTIQLRDVLSDDQLATAEWLFLDSATVISQGMISIRLTENQIGIIKIFTSKNEVNETADPSSRRNRAQRASQPAQTVPDMNYYYYSRSSPGGMADAQGLNISQVFTCETPGTIKGKFSPEDLKGPFATQQEAAQKRIEEIKSSRDQSIDITPVIVKCTN